MLGEQTGNKAITITKSEYIKGGKMKNATLDVIWGKELLH